MGRVNYGPLLGEREGVTGSVRHGTQYQHGWQIDPLDLANLYSDSLPWDRSRSTDAVLAPGSAFHRASIHVDAPSDAFLELLSSVPFWYVASPTWGYERGYERRDETALQW